MKYVTTAVYQGSNFRKFACAVASLGVAFFVYVLLMSVAHAAVTTNTSADITTPNQTIKASSNATAVIGLNMVVSASEKFASTSVSIAATNGFVLASDLAALGTATSSGIAIYRDDAVTGTNGSFDSTDDVVPLVSAPTFTGATTTLELAVAETAPADNSGANAGADYFIVVRTAAGATNGRSFAVRLYPGEVGYDANKPTATPTALTTNAITVDTVAPTLNTNMSGPSNGATGVPVSTFVHLGFSEMLNQSTLNSTNVTFTKGGVAVGAAIRPFPDGFDIVASSPPTYAASSRFAKASTGGTGFFHIQGTSAITPQGAYAVPTAGDIVYQQFDTFPPEVGIITDATLTSGTFAINGFAPFRPLQLTKFATPTATGAVSGGSVIGVGDLLVANTFANPTTTRYAWHIASTSAAINSANLRLDDAALAPTLISGSSFSRLMPTATSTISTAQMINATTTFSQGDLVFAKISTGGDNLNTYAWHLVTTAETVNGLLGEGASPGTTTTLRLDGASAAPTFTRFTVLAKLSTAANGPVDGAVAQDATSFSLGDIMLAKVTANAANTGSFAFHLVSNGATGATSTALRLDNNSSNLDSSSTYVVTATTAVTDAAGNPLASNQTITFTTGSTGGTNTTPPFVQSSQPQSGNQSFSLNAPIKITFSVAMNTDIGGTNSVLNTAVAKLNLDSNGAIGAAVAATNTYDSTTNTLTITPTSALTANTSYVVQVLPIAKSTTGISLPNDFRLYFRTGASSDSTGPRVIGSSPANGVLDISRSQVFSVGFSEDMDPSTISISTVTLKQSNNNAAVVGNVTYGSQSRSAYFAPTTLLSANEGYTLRVISGASGVKDLAGNATTTDYTALATTTAAADSTDPIVSFASADNFGVAVTFSETMKTGGGPNAADNIANYTLESPTGSSISLGGKTVTYDAGTKTARINGLSLQNGNQFKVTVGTPAQDLGGRGMSTTGSPAGNIAVGTVQNSTVTGGQLGPGSGSINFSEQGMNPTRVTPSIRLAGATTTYKGEFLAATSIPLGGQVVLTFPAGFTLSSATAVAAASSFCNTDMNGPAAGAVTIASVAANQDAGTVTITTAGAATGANAFVCFEIANIINSTVPNTSGYTVDVKTRDTAANNRAILETKTASPFFLGQGGSSTLTVNVFKDLNGNGALNAGEAIAAARVFVFSPAIGGQSATTTTAGVATFASLANGDYMVGIDPGSISGVGFNSAPQLVTVSGATTKNFALSASALTISGTVTGPNGTSVDVFGSSNNGFTKTTVALTGGADAYSLPVASSTTYNIGVGPAMPEAFFTPGAPPPPPPTFTFMPPPNITVPVGTASVTGKNFVLSTASKTITGSVLDANGSAVSNAGVFARPVATSTNASHEGGLGFGTGGMTNSSGAFSLNVIPGTYLVGVAKPGMPNIPDQEIVVPSSGANTPSSLTFTMSVGSSLTVSGTVKDSNGNAVPYAGVSGRRVQSSSDTSVVGGGSNNFIGGPTDANGAYTLYVTAGTWVIEAYAPGFGKLGSKTVIVSSSSLSGQDFSAATLSLGTVTGQATKATVAQQGVIVRAEGTAGGNMTVTDTAGNYSLKLPAGTYTLYCMFPGIGEATPVSNVAVTADTTTPSQNCSIGAPITLTVKVTDGTNPVTNAYVDARDSNGRGGGTSDSTSSGAYATYSVVVPPGTYTVRIGHPAYGSISNTTGVNATQTITATTTAGVLYAVTGTVKASGSALSSAWVTLFGTPTGQSNKIHLGAQSNASGAFSISAPAGTYQIRADKPGYISPSLSSVTVTAATAVGDISMGTAGLTISGTVNLAGTGAISSAFVDATNGSGGFAVAQSSADGTYSLSVTDGTWTLTARSIGYAGTKEVVMGGASQTGQTINLSAISGFTASAASQETITPTEGGIVTNSNIGSSFKLNIPANALGTGSNAGTVKTQANTAVPNPPSGSVLAKNAVSITAVDSSGQPVKNLNDDVTIVVPYTEADLPAGTSEADLQLGVWNDATQTYDTLSTTVDTTNNTLTAVVSHFSDFAPIVPSGASTPSSSSSSGSTSSGGGGGGGGAGTVTSTTLPRLQKINPDGTIEYLDQASVTPAGTQTAAPVVIPRVAIIFTKKLAKGSRGDEVTRLQQLLATDKTIYPDGSVSGFWGVLTQAAVERFQEKYGIAKKGDDGFGTFGPKTRAKIAEVFSAKGAASAEPIPAQTETMASTPAAVMAAAPVSGVLTRGLALGSRSDDVKMLQILLNRDAETQIVATGDGSPGMETNFFGSLTRKAVERFQMKHGLSRDGDPGFGYVGPKTRAALNALSNQ